MGWFDSKEERLEEEIKTAHNQGQTDASNGEYHIPYSTPKYMFDFSLRSDEMDKVNEAYEEGHEHATSQKEGCFLTTACVEYAGLPDDCHELTVLRSFRNNYVARLAYGPVALAEYYKVAPSLVRQIEQSNERNAILAGIFSTVSRAVVMIERGNYQEAFICYEAMFADLKKRYHVCA